MFGGFPPPIHGMSAATQAMYQRLLDAGYKVKKIDTAPTSLNRGAVARLKRVKVVVSALQRLCLVNCDADRRVIVYLALSGGWGQVYDLMAALICRIKGMQCIMHHHSVAYLVKKSKLTSLLCSVSGAKYTTHIVLCDFMKKKLEQHYAVGSVNILSNSVFFPKVTECVDKKTIEVIGFISNITYEKGAGIVIELAREINRRGIPINVVVAGPCSDKDLADTLRLCVSEGVLEWRGAVYNEAKSKFWKDIDAFVFPTLYENEAEPLVIWEALSESVPVIAYDRGCISSQLIKGGEVIPKDIGFVDGALNTLSEWEDSIYYQKICMDARERYMEANKETVFMWEKFLSLLK